MTTDLKILNVRSILSVMKQIVGTGVEKLRKQSFRAKSRESSKLELQKLHLSFRQNSFDNLNCLNNFDTDELISGHQRSVQSEASRSFGQSSLTNV